MADIRFAVEREKKEIKITPEILKELQAIQLEILIEFDRICNENHIDYSLDGGTLLGAVRHKGFIPWDDDIDIIMLRRDYEKFYKLYTSGLINEKFFLQEHRTDKFYMVGYPRIQRNNTIYRRAGHEHMKYHQGVFIDLFVLDNVPDSKFLRSLHRLLCFCCRKILWSKSGKKLAKNIVLRMWWTIVALIPAKFAFGLNNTLAHLANKRETVLVRHNTHPYPNPKVCGYGIPRVLLDSFTTLEFEGIKFKAVMEYDKYLTMLYGDYMKLPSRDKQVPHIHLAAFEGVKK